MASTFKSLIEDDETGALVEFEKLVGTQNIVKKYQKLIYEEDFPVESDSSEEPFQFNIDDAKADRINRRREKESRLIAQRKKLTSRERIATHRARFGGCGVFRKNNLSVKAERSGSSATENGIQKESDDKLDQEEAEESEYDPENPPFRRQNVIISKEPKKRMQKGRNKTIVFGSKRSHSNMMR